MEQHRAGAEINVTCFKKQICLYQIKTQRDVFSSCILGEQRCFLGEHTMFRKGSLSK